MKTTKSPTNSVFFPNEPRKVHEGEIIVAGNTGKYTTLSLQTNSLVVKSDSGSKLNNTSVQGIHEEESRNTKSYKCFGLCSIGAADPCVRVIPFYNILWAELIGTNLTIRYASPVSKTVVKPAILKYTADIKFCEPVQEWIQDLLHRSYGVSKWRKRIKVLVNPQGGKGAAIKMYFRNVEPLLKAAHCQIDVEQTKHRGHACEIAENLEIEAFDVVASCSGDGLPYEVFNGFGKRVDARKALSNIAVVQIPCGSGNAMSCNLNGTNSASMATLAIIKGIPTSLDLISITQGKTRTLSFLSQSVGIIAEADLATEHLRFLGAHRFTYGLLKRLFRKMTYPCDIAIKVAISEKSEIKDLYRNNKTYLEKLCENGESNNKYLHVDDTSTTSSDDDGLPDLEFGTVNDKLPEGWELVPYEKLGNFYCGNMAYMSPNANFFSATLPNDGFMDLICINGDLKLHSAITMISAVEDGTLIDRPEVWYRKILGYRIIPRNQDDGYISIDGERIPFAPFQAEIHPGLGTVLSKTGYRYETTGVF
ncbi:unnamed protein product [Blumeria hordei]|uniref:DAGKc domain-containing protein n=1 Tax=Blumeria hordei TaxID=2867405 RepID=A0A383UY40_BLUHO|nr:unnamed protein product [Blumeria hordei]